MNGGRPAVARVALLSLLPASAAVIGFLILRQVPTLVEMAGVAIHQDAEARPA